MSDLIAAAKALINGHLVALPTETVYGLGADATNQAAVDRIFEVKGRPRNHPLIVHLAGVEDLTDWAVEIPEYAEELAESFWPGPMTLVLKRSQLAQDFITGGQDTVGLRVPNHPVALELLREFRLLGGKGIAAPSANIFGKVSPTKSDDVYSELKTRLGENDLVLEGGVSAVGVESTIIDCTQELPAILRPGAITTEMITQVTGLAVRAGDTQIRVSGSLKSHYAPVAKVVLDGEPQPGDGLIALASYPTPDGVTRLAEPKDNAEYARELYSALRKADTLGLSKVIAVLPEGDDIAVAIRDRLTRSAH